MKVINEEIEREIVITSGLKEELDSFTLCSIVNILYKKIKFSKAYIDYLQVFEYLNGKIIHSQEFPREIKDEYEILNIKPFGKIYAIKQEEEDKKYWVIMLASEY